ncbi:MAG: response regulator transcription factor [Acidobacteria bacterium]|nr:response regulator transcription factor [Acidobacteriota bacterium]
MNKLKVFLVDDEPLAIKRLSRLLDETENVEIIGQTNEPLEALKMIPDMDLDAIFLDIQMPELTGFELLQKLKTYPPVIFTTAFDEFALKAFEVYSVDYLLKPIESERLKMALKKLDAISANSANYQAANIQKLLENFAENQTFDKESAIERIASRVGARVQILNVREITHFFSEEKVTFAKDRNGKEFPLDDSLNKLEEKLDSNKFLRVHRSAIVNLDQIEEVHGWFSGRVLVRLKDGDRTEIVVARNRIRALKSMIGM